MPLSSDLSHGFLDSILPSNSVYCLYQKLKQFTLTNGSKTYYSHLESVFSVDELFIDNILCVAESILECSSLILCNIELHYLTSPSMPIPFHQDNFYHCIDNPLHGLKILLPLQVFTADNGALFYLDTPINFPTLLHTPSNVPNFSSFIPQTEVDQLAFSTTSYSYQRGDASFHYLSSVHSSLGNRASLPSYFLVYRINTSIASENLKCQQVYNDCYQQHVKLLLDTRN